MLKVYVWAIILGSFSSSHSTEVGSDVSMTVNRQASELICETQKGIFQNVLATIQIPNFSSGSVLSVSLLNIVGLQIKAVNILQFSVEFVPETKSELTIEADLHIEAKALLTVVDLKITAEIVTEVEITKGTNGSPLLTITACKSVLGDLQIVSSGLLSIPLDLLQIHLHDIFYEQLCLKISVVIDLLTVELGAINALTDFSSVSQIQYALSSAPEVTNEIVELSFNVVFYLSGKILDLGLAPMSISLPAPSSSSSPLLSLALSENVFVLLYTTIQESGLLNFEITGQTIGDENKLTTAALSAAIPQINELYPVSLSIILKNVVDKSPMVTLEAGKLTLHLTPSVEILAKPPSGDAISLLVLDLHVLLNVTIKTVHRKLSSSVAVIGDFSLSLQTSTIGSVDVSELQNLISSTLIDAYLLQLNDALGVGLTLPTLFSMDLTDPAVTINPGFVWLSFTLQLPF